MKRDSVVSARSRWPMTGPMTGGNEPTGKGGCCGVSDMVNGSPGYWIRMAKAPAGIAPEPWRGDLVADGGSDMPYGMGIGR